MKTVKGLHKNIIFILREYFITLVITLVNIQKSEALNCKEGIIEPLNNQICACCLNFDAVKENVTNIDEQLESTKKELEETKAELEETKKELEETKKELEETKEELKANEEGQKDLQEKVNAFMKEFYDANGEIDELGEFLKKIKEENSLLIKQKEKQEVEIEKLKNEIIEKNVEGLENYNNILREKEVELGKLKNENKENSERINVLTLENNNLEERLKNVSSNTDVEDLQKFRAEDDKKVSLDIIKIFNSNEIGKPIEDKCIFYLPFKFIGNDFIFIEDLIKEKNDIQKEKNNIQSPQRTKFNEDLKGGGRYTVDNEHKFLGRTRNKNKDLSKGNNPDLEPEFFHENYLAENSANPGGYPNLTIELLTRYIFSQSSIEKRKKQPCINIKTLKKLYLVAKGGNYVLERKNIDKNEDKKEDEKEKEDNKKNKKGDKKKWKEDKKEKEINKKKEGKKVKEKKEEENKERKEVEEKKKLVLDIVNKNGLEKVSFKGGVFYDEKNHDIEPKNVKTMNLDKILEEINLDYQDFVKFCSVDEYVSSNAKEKFFLLQLDLSDPECIALLEQVGKGNYGVVKKGLILENNKFVPKAIKFTCTNDEFETSKEENIKKEILAGRVAKLMGTENIAYIQDYMTIERFITRKSKKNEELKGTLKDAWEECLSRDEYEKFQEGRQDIKKCFENNVFKNNGKIGNKLYVMIMDLINGEDLFKWGKDVDVDKLGDTLFEILTKGYIFKVALKDIKAKNVMYDDKKDKFGIIDVQTLGKVDGNLTDSFGTPEYWPFFKTLNINFEEFKKKEKKFEEDDLLTRYCNIIDSNFVDIYSACMTMYFSKFKTLTAAGLLTLLLKWRVLEEENENTENWEKISLDEKIKFLKNYSEKYKAYIKNKEREVNVVENLGSKFDEDKIIFDNTPEITFFFENIDDRNLNNNQKKKLAGYLYKFINENNNIFILEDIKNRIEKPEKELDNKNKIEEFFKECINQDFSNFKKLEEGNCKYADIIKYVLCFGSCLNYSSNEEKLDVNELLRSIQLKKNIKKGETVFFENNKEINSKIEKLKGNFNQKFVSDLLKILSLEEYYKIADVRLSNVAFHLKDKKNKEMEKKAFYLLKHLENEKLLFVPRNLVKIHGMINSSEIKNEIIVEK